MTRDLFGITILLAQPIVIGLPLYRGMRWTTALTLHALLVIAWILGAWRRWDNIEYSIPLLTVSILLAMLVPTLYKMRGQKERERQLREQKLRQWEQRARPASSQNADPQTPSGRDS